MSWAWSSVPVSRGPHTPAPKPCRPRTVLLARLPPGRGGSDAVPRGTVTLLGSCSHHEGPHLESSGHQLCPSPLHGLLSGAGLSVHVGSSFPSQTHPVTDSASSQTRPTSRRGCVRRGWEVRGHQSTPARAAPTPSSPGPEDRPPAPSHLLSQPPTSSMESIISLLQSVRSEIKWILNINNSL